MDRRESVCARVLRDLVNAVRIRPPMLRGVLGDCPNGFIREFFNGSMRERDQVMLEDALFVLSFRISIETPHGMVDVPEPSGVADAARARSFRQMLIAGKSEIKAAERQEQLAAQILDASPTSGTEWSSFADILYACVTAVDVPGVAYWQLLGMSNSGEGLAQTIIRNEPITAVMPTFLVYFCRRMGLRLVVSGPLGTWSSGPMVPDGPYGVQARLMHEGQEVVRSLRRTNAEVGVHDAAVRDLILKNQSYAAIAATLGITKQRVGAIAKRLGIATSQMTKKVVEDSQVLHKHTLPKRTR